MEALDVSQTVMDEYAARILLGTFERAASALELSHRFRIPIAACYRRIRQLESMGLVYCEKALPSRNGKGLQLFRSRVRSVRISLEEGKLRARVLLGRPDATDPVETQETEQVLDLIERAA
ncbi:MAG: hypothetical protein A3K68_01935 [Euryarchaeota archaeon RBG_16_68_13]|nr:MAG: hypothetical protein A3K68_01935 [Euryarchaeota archaeon RBG_16_68_13]